MLSCEKALKKWTDRLLSYDGPVTKGRMMRPLESGGYAFCPLGLLCDTIKNSNLVFAVNDGNVSMIGGWTTQVLTTNLEWFLGIDSIKVVSAWDLRGKTLVEIATMLNDGIFNLN